MIKTVSQDIISIHTVTAVLVYSVVSNAIKTNICTIGVGGDKTVISINVLSLAVLYSLSEM